MIITGSQNISDHSGDIFLLLGRSASLGLSDNAHSFIVAAGDQQSVSFYPPAGDTHETLIDVGQGLSVFVSGDSSVTVLGFGHDKAGHVTLLNAGFENVADAVASERPDGHGGVVMSSLIATVDFIGVQNVDASHIGVVNI
jgi:hypothetical protein